MWTGFPTALRVCWESGQDIGMGFTWVLGFDFFPSLYVCSVSGSQDGALVGIYFLLESFQKKPPKGQGLLQLSMAAPRAWRKSGQDVGWVFTWPVAPSLLSSSAGETTRSASPGVNTRSVARLVGVAFLSTSALVHLVHLFHLLYLVHLFHHSGSSR